MLSSTMSVSEKKKKVNVDEKAITKPKRRKIEYEEDGEVYFDEDYTETHSRVRISGPVKWFDSFLNVIDKFGVKRVLQGLFLLVMFFLAHILYNVLTNEKVISAVVENMTTQESETERTNMQIRGDVGPKISQNLMKLLYSINADRAFVMEMHNGKENVTELPFVYFDMTYEETNEGRDVAYISESFSNMNISYFKVPYYLVEHTYFVGDKNSLLQIDRRFYNRFEEIGGQYIGLIMIKSHGVNIGILGVTYNQQPSVTSTDIHEKLDEYVQTISSLLDLNEQKK